MLNFHHIILKAKIDKTVMNSQYYIGVFAFTMGSKIMTSIYM